MDTLTGILFFANPFTIHFLSQSVEYISDSVSHIDTTCIN